MSVKSISEVFEQMTLNSFRNSDPETSKAAATDAVKHAATHRSRCYDLLRSAGEMGLTDFELVDAFKRRYGGQPQQTSLGKRRGELRDAELVVAKVVDGRTVKRPSPSGSLAIVWQVAS